MIVSTFFITFAGWFVTARIVEPRLGKYDVTCADETVDGSKLGRLAMAKGLIWAGVSVVVTLLTVARRAAGVVAFGVDAAPGYGAAPVRGATGATRSSPAQQRCADLIFFRSGRGVRQDRRDDEERRDAINAMADA